MAAIPEAQIILHLDRAIQRRASLWENGETDCFRLLGEGDGLSGIFLDKFGDVGILQVHTGRCEFSDSDLATLANAVCARGLLRSIYHKRFDRDRSAVASCEDLFANRPLVGPAVADSVIGRENGRRFEVHPFDGYSAGLFLDQRENRLFLSTEFAGKRVLNLFAYTGGFSVYCASRGSQVTTVDLSKRYLEWGKRNFELNDLSLDSHRFFLSDAFEFIERAKKKAWQYDLVIIDPPSFSRGRQTFSVAKDAARLAQAAWDVTADKGTLFFSNNYEGWDERSFQQLVVNALGKGAENKSGKLPAPPIDFPQTPLKCVLLSRRSR